MDFRLATLNDCDLIFRWANDQLVRRNAFNSGNIDYESHCKWYSSKMKSPTVRIIIFFEREQPVGQLRLELIKQEILIDYSVDEAYRGKGLGVEILKLAKKISLTYFSENFDLVGKVMKYNEVSKHAFARAGYEESEEESYYVYRWNAANQY